MTEKDQSRLLPPEAGVRPGPARGELIAAAVLLLAVNLATALAFWLNAAGGSSIGIRAFPLDDGWIHMVYARSLATTLRPEYNPGQMESGMTSLLWVILNALAYWPGKWLGLNPTIMPKLLSLAFGWLTALLVYVIMRWRNVARHLSLAAALVLSVDPGWCFSKCSGMEVTLFSFCLLLAMVALDRRSSALLGWAIGLATIARPEGLLLLATVLPLGLWEAFTGRKPCRDYLLMVLPVTLLFGGWILYNLFVAGRPLPNTFYVKAQSGLLFRGDNLLFILRRMVLGAEFFRSYVGAALGVVGAAYLLRKNARANLGLVVFPALFIYAISLTHPFTQSQPFYWARYFHPVYPFLIPAVFFGLAWLEEIAGPRLGLSKTRFGRYALPLLSLAILALVVFPMARSFPRQATLFSTNCRDIHNGNVRVGEWLRDNTRPGDRVVTMDAGAIRYFSERVVLDLVGLNDHNVSGGEGILSRLREVKPAYYALFPDNFGPTIAAWGLQPVFTVVNDPYTICDCPSQATITVYVFPGL
jgi:hypothetical protein